MLLEILLLLLSSGVLHGNHLLMCHLLHLLGLRLTTLHLKLLIEGGLLLGLETLGRDASHHLELLRLADDLTRDDASEHLLLRHHVEHLLSVLLSVLLLLLRHSKGLLLGLTALADHLLLRDSRGLLLLLGRLGLAYLLLVLNLLLSIGS